MDHGRLPWLAPGDLDEAQKHLYDQVVGGPRSKDTQTSALVDEKGRLHGPFNALLVDPAVGDAVQNLGSAIRYRTALTPRAREIATLIVSCVHQSNFEWHAHARLGRAAGLSEEEIDSIAAGHDASSLAADELLIAKITRALIATRDLDDELFDEAHVALGDVIIMELVMLVGFYELLARSLQVWRTPLPDGAEPKFR